MSFFSLTGQRLHREKSLFERIRDNDALLRGGQTSSLDIQIASVRQHLQKVLNTRSGNCRSAPELGVTDMNDISQSEADIYGSLCEAVRQCISQYEPGLYQVSVTAEYDTARLEMVLKITGMMKPGSARPEQEVSFRVVIRDQQRYLIQ